jgi:hypothetical protein
VDFVVEKEAEGVEMDYSSLRGEAGVMLEVFGVEPNLNLGLTREAFRKDLTPALGVVIVGNGTLPGDGGDLRKLRGGVSFNLRLVDAKARHDTLKLFKTSIPLVRDGENHREKGVKLLFGTGLENNVWEGRVKGTKEVRDLALDDSTGYNETPYSNGIWPLKGEKLNVIGQRRLDHGVGESRRRAVLHARKRVEEGR